MNCLNCGIKNENSNFCNKCGFKLQVIDTCGVCHEKRTLKTLTCGHSFCGDCLFSIYLSNTQHCPQCRKPFNKCYKCFNYRVSNRTCLDCNSKEKIYACNNCLYIYSIINSTILEECVNCKKKNISLIPIDYTDIDKIKIKKKEEINPDLIEVCNNCLSSNIIISLSGINLCYNCNKINTKIIKIPDNILSKLPVLDKDLVNPEKLELCSHCFSKDLSISNDNIDNYCNNCNLNTSGIKILKKYQSYFKVFNKNVVNPNKIKICKNCFNDKFVIKEVNKRKNILCTICNSNFEDSIFIYEYDRDLYPIKQI